MNDVFFFSQVVELLSQNTFILHTCVIYLIMSHFCNFRLPLCGYQPKFISYVHKFTIKNCLILGIKMYISILPKV